MHPLTDGPDPGRSWQRGQGGDGVFDHDLVEAPDQALVRTEDDGTDVLGRRSTHHARWLGRHATLPKTLAQP